MIKMNKYVRHLIMLMTISLAFIQILCINKSKNDKNITESITQNKLHNYKTLNEFNKELDCLNSKNILSAHKIDKKWHISIKILGNKEEMLTDVAKLKYYDINSYIINKNKDETNIILEISDKESV